MHHTYWPSSNPRLADRCACGRSEVEHPQAPTTRPRDVDHEHRLIREAARGRVDPSALIVFAERRIQAHSSSYVGNPMLVSLEHEKLGMAREELADCGNYLAWWLQDHASDGRVADIQAALRHVVLAFDLISKR